MGICINMIDSCILCESKKIKVVQNILKKDLTNLYRDSFNFDVSKYLKNEIIKCYKCDSCKLSFFDPDTAGTGKFYEELQEARNQYYNPERKEFLFANKFIKSKDKVLEIGAGYGHFSKMLSTKDYLGIEFNDKAIKEANKEGVKLVKEDIIKMSTKNIEKFDVVCSFHVLEHVQNLKKFIEASIKTLKHDGILIIAVPCNDSILTSNHNHVLNLPPHHINRFYIKTMKCLQEEYSLTLIDYKLDSVWGKIPHMNYVTSFIVKKVLNLFFPSQTVVTSKSRFEKVNNFIHKLNKKMRLYKIFKTKPIPENMTFIYKKEVAS